MLPNSQDLLGLCRMATYSAENRSYDVNQVDALCTIKMDDWKHAMSVAKPSITRGVMEKILEVSWDDIGGLKDLKKKLQQAVEWPIKYSSSFARLGISPTRGILLYGPPGCSKTTLALAIAHVAQASFFSLRVWKISKESSSDQLPQWISNSDNKKSRKLAASSSKKGEIIDDSYIKQQALVASMLYHHHMQNGDLPNLDRSISVKHTPPSSNKLKKLQKRSYSVSDSRSKALQLIHQDVGTEESDKMHFVLVHGGGFGAWCWYKIIALLKESKHEVEAIELTGSGLNSCDINCITTLAEYSKPLTDFLAKLEDGNKVILVGHDFGGACVSYAMELYPAKVSKAIFVAAAMLNSGQGVLDVFSQKSCLNDLNQRAWKFLYANGKNHPPTAIDLDKSLLEDFLFNRTSTKDIALASVSMRQVPFAPLADKISLSTENYGSIPRFYIKTEEDYAIPLPLQEAMIKSNQPKQVFQLKGSDHSPFFSRPQALHRLLIEVSKITSV